MANDSETAVTLIFINTNKSLDILTMTTTTNDTQPLRKMTRNQRKKKHTQTQFWCDMEKWTKQKWTQRTTGTTIKLRCEWRSAPKYFFFGHQWSTLLLLLLCLFIPFPFSLSLCLSVAFLPVWILYGSSSYFMLIRFDNFRTSQVIHYVLIP